MTVRRGSSPRALPALACASLLLAGAAGMEHLRVQTFPVDPALATPPYVPSGATLRRLSVGYNALAADVYWIQAIQYYGRERLRLATLASAPIPGSRERASHGCSPFSMSPRHSIHDSALPIDSGRFSSQKRFRAALVGRIWPSPSCRRGCGNDLTSGPTCSTSGKCVPLAPPGLPKRGILVRSGKPRTLKPRGGSGRWRP